MPASSATAATRWPCPGDVTDEADGCATSATCSPRWGRIDILVNNAALIGVRRVLDETAEPFRRAVFVSRWAPCSTPSTWPLDGRAGHPRLDRLHLLLERLVRLPRAYFAYAFHKGGVNNFVRAAAMDLAPYGIRVNSFTPTAPNPDNPELLAERAARGLGPRGGVLSRPDHGGGLGEPDRRPRSGGEPRTGARARGAPMVPMGSTGTPTDIGHADRLALLRLRPADHRHRPGRRRRRPGEEPRLHSGRARPSWPARCR